MRLQRPRIVFGGAPGAVGVHIPNQDSSCWALVDCEQAGAGRSANAKVHRIMLHALHGAFYRMYPGQGLACLQMLL